MSAVKASQYDSKQSIDKLKKNKLHLLPTFQVERASVWSVPDKTTSASPNTGLCVIIPVYSDFLLYIMPLGANLTFMGQISRLVHIRGVNSSSLWVKPVVRAWRNQGKGAPAVPDGAADTLGNHS